MRLDAPAPAASLMKRLLLCVDGSAYSEVCGRYAAWFAARAGGAIDGVYVSDVWRYETSFLTDIGGSLGIAPYQDMLDKLRAIEEQKSQVVEAALRALLAEVKFAGPLTFHHRTGAVVECLAAFEKGPDGASLVMLGKRGENSNLATEHLGSTMERVVRASTQPCLVTPRRYAPIQRVLVAYDGSPSATKALNWLAQAQAFRDLEAHLVCVSGGGDDAVSAQRLKEGESLLRGGGCKPVCQLLSGVSGDAIAEYVNQRKIDWLLMGAYGHGTIRRLLIGSTTTDLLRRCHVPVMLFR
jgi:nucleotide-binding universal stress UspA family protein